MTLAIAHSTPEPEAIAGLVAEHWDIGPILECSLERAWTNDVFRIETATETWFLKLARRRWRAPSDTAWETELLHHLVQSGIPVSTPWPTRSGELSLTIALPEGARGAFLCQQVAGTRPPKPPTVATYVALGNLAARLHVAMDAFGTPCPRQVNDVEFLVTRSIPIIRSRISASEHKSFGLEDLAEAVVARLDNAPLEMGLCHGDLTLDNVRFDDDGQLHVFDFDLCTRMWRAREVIGMYGWSVNAPDEASAFWSAWLEGYRSVRPFPEAWESLMPAVAGADGIHDLAHTIQHWERWTGRWMTEQALMYGTLDSIMGWRDKV